MPPCWHKLENEQAMDKAAEDELSAARSTAFKKSFA